MNARVKKLVSQILEFRNDYTDVEILEAMKYVASESLNDAGSPKKSGERERKSKTGHSRGSRTSIPKASRVVLALKNSDPEKYNILATLDSLLRTGTIVPAVDGIRSIGTSIDKSFDAGQSRKDAIPRLMKLLAGLPIEQLRDTVEAIMQSQQNDGNRSDEEAFSRLAAFLIQGK